MVFDLDMMTKPGIISIQEGDYAETVDGVCGVVTRVEIVDKWSCVSKRVNRIEVALCGDTIDVEDLLLTTTSTASRASTATSDGTFTFFSAAATSRRSKSPGPGAGVVTLRQRCGRGSGYWSAGPTIPTLLRATGAWRGILQRKRPKWGGIRGAVHRRLGSISLGLASAHLSAALFVRLRVLLCSRRTTCRS